MFDHSTETLTIWMDGSGYWVGALTCTTRTMGGSVGIMGMDAAPGSPPPAPASAGGTAVILFTDIVDSTALTD